VDYVKYIAERIQQLRAQKGVSSYIMSYEIERGKNYMKNIESGLSNPSWPMFFCICEYLEVTPKEFFDTEDASPRETRDFITVFGDLSEENRQIVLNLAKKLKEGQ